MKSTFARSFFASSQVSSFPSEVMFALRSPENVSSYSESSMLASLFPLDLVDVRRLSLRQYLVWSIVLMLRSLSLITVRLRSILHGQWLQLSDSEFLLPQYAFQTLELAGKTHLVFRMNQESLTRSRSLALFFCSTIFPRNSSHSFCN